ncbi:UDP-glycosyltransferase 76G1-like [Rutidosis leptorrhynchoides]|uniref:UDP-glycosyltransferase 76G1-like n=1 Tax=Rutidosis leptorrhynchoides TaxID=125765 RepID=UPI003A99AD61
MENQGETSSCRRLRVVLFPLPFQGHINPMLQLANILYSKSFSITIIHTNFNSIYTSKYPHFTFRPVLDNDSKNSNLAMLSSKGIGDLLSGIIMLNQCSADNLRQELEYMITASLQQQERIVCLITDALWYFTQSVADSLKLPRIVLRTSSLFCVVVYASIPILDEQAYFNHVDSVYYEENMYTDMDNANYVKRPESSESGPNYPDLEERVSEIPILKLKDILKMRIKGQADPTASLLANMLKQTKASSGIIWNSFKELEEPELEKILKDFHVPCFLIGPFHKYFPASLSSLMEPDTSFMSWLNQQSPNSVLNISFGSTAQLEEQDFLEMAHGLADSMQPFLWVMRPAFVKGSEWMKSLPNGFIDSVGDRGRIVKWAPQQDVLAHEAIGAFWTHNGWNSTLESICEGVPMICSPFWGDQPLDARYVTDVLKVGVYLENGWSRDEIARTVRRVMEEEGEELRKSARCLKEKVSASIIKGGSSYEYLESLVRYISSF